MFTPSLIQHPKKTHAREMTVPLNSFGWLNQNVWLTLARKFEFLWTNPTLVGSSVKTRLRVSSGNHQHRTGTISPRQEPCTALLRLFLVEFVIKHTCYQEHSKPTVWCNRAEPSFACCWINLRSVPMLQHTVKILLPSEGEWIMKFLCV